jgi:hypothetical protein
MAIQLLLRMNFPIPHQALTAKQNLQHQRLLEKLITFSSAVEVLEAGHQPFNRRAVAVVGVVVRHFHNFKPQSHLVEHTYFKLALVQLSELETMVIFHACVVKSVRLLQQ